jgi:hypothetical protein
MGILIRKALARLVRFKSTVAPAKAGAYLVCRFKPNGVMDPSLCWGDVIFEPNSQDLNKIRKHLPRQLPRLNPIMRRQRIDHQPLKPHRRL